MYPSQVNPLIAVYFPSVNNVIVDIENVVFEEVVDILLKTSWEDIQYLHSELQYWRVIVQITRGCPRLKLPPSLRHIFPLPTM